MILPGLMDCVWLLSYISLATDAIRAAVECGRPFRPVEARYLSIAPHELRPSTPGHGGDGDACGREAKPDAFHELGPGGHGVACKRGDSAYGKQTADKPQAVVGEHRPSMGCRLGQ